MRLDELQNGQQVKARWGRAGEEGPAWGAWRDVTLHVQRTTVSGARRSLRRGESGRIAVLALKTLDGQPINWAEYAERDFEDNVFLVEDYYLEIEGLVP